MDLELLSSARLNHYLWRLKYLFQSGRTLKHVTLMLTNMCDYHCPMCECNAGKRLPNELKTEEILGVLNEIKRMGASSVTLIGGELLLRPDVFKILAHVNSLRLFLQLATNCSQVEKHIEEFRQLQIDSLLASVDGVAWKNNEFRGHPRAFERVIEAIRFFKIQGSYPILVNTVVHPGNIDGLSSLGSQLLTAGVDLWRLTPVLPAGRAKACREMYLDDNQLLSLLSFVKENRHRFRCILSEELGFLPNYHRWFNTSPYFDDAGLYSCAINPEGYVLGDLTLYEPKYFEGNIREKPLSEIWRDGFTGYRKPLVPEQCQSCPYFAACNGGNMAIRGQRQECLRRLFPAIMSFGNN